jgi:hypothetical protein
MKTKPKLGPPFKFSAPMLRVLVMLDADSIKRAKTLGRGNVSAGIRKALAA